MTQVIKTKIAGIFKYPDAKVLVKALKPGDLLTCKAEPDNAYDPRAIAIFVSDKANPERKEKCGYIPANVACNLTENRVSAIVCLEKFSEIELHVEDSNEQAA